MQNVRLEETSAPSHLTPLISGEKVLEMLSVAKEPESLNDSAMTELLGLLQVVYKHLLNITTVPARQCAKVFNFLKP